MGSMRCLVKKYKVDGVGGSVETEELLCGRLYLGNVTSDVKTVVPNTPPAPNGWERRRLLVQSFKVVGRCGPYVSVSASRMVFYGEGQHDHIFWVRTYDTRSGKQVGLEALVGQKLASVLPARRIQDRPDNRQNRTMIGRHDVARDVLKSGP